MIYFHYNTLGEFTMRKKILSLILSVTLLAPLSSCEEKNKSKPLPSLEIKTEGRDLNFTFSEDESEYFELSDSGAEAVLESVHAQMANYELADMYNIDETKERLDFNSAAEKHQYSALNEDGVLEASHFAELVFANNEKFLADKPFNYITIDDSKVKDICKFIVRIVGEMKEKYPDIDWDRVYCNLGNLKILNKNGTLSYAQVTEKHVLIISEHNNNALLAMKGEGGFPRVLIHEIMHIIQVGCDCEEVTSQGRRAGISVSWDDLSWNTTDWLWLVEGSAERNMCNLTGMESVTYQFKMDYICSFTMSVLLRDSVSADTMETLCFYDDPELLFSAFGCESEEERDELLRMMITMDIMQTQPDNFFLLYKEKTGVDISDIEERNQFSITLKPAVCVSLAKEFYENLVPFIQKNDVSLNDLFFLLNCFEGHLNQHLDFANESKAEINEPFIIAYTAMRNSLFEALSADNPDMDFEALYGEYEISSAENTVNASLNMLSEDKRSFLLERSEWQNSLKDLGVKVPLSKTRS